MKNLTDQGYSLTLSAQKETALVMLRNCVALVVIRHDTSFPYHEVLYANVMLSVARHVLMVLRA